MRLSPKIGQTCLGAKSDVAAAGDSLPRQARRQRVPAGARMRTSSVL